VVLHPPFRCSAVHVQAATGASDSSRFKFLVRINWCVDTCWRRGAGVAVSVCVAAVCGCRASLRSGCVPACAPRRFHNVGVLSFVAHIQPLRLYREDERVRCGRRCVLCVHVQVATGRASLSPSLSPSLRAARGLDGDRCASLASARREQVR
jgi:hypothetical protein